MAAAGWRPDPTGRFTKRYFDGSQWTHDVLDENDVPSDDPYTASPLSPRVEARPSESGTGTKRKSIDWIASSITAGVILACAVVVLLSVVSLAWFTAAETGSADVKLSDFKESGIGISVVSGAPFAMSYDDVGISQSYADVGRFVSLVAVCLAAVAAFAPWPVRFLAATLVAGCAAWHVLALDDLTRNVSAAPGAFVGAGSLAVAAVAVVAIPALFSARSKLGRSPSDPGALPR